MPLSLIHTGSLPSRRYLAGGGAALALSVAIAVTAVSSPQLARSALDKVDQGLAGMRTVAAMLAERSPGERPEGTLASLKPKRQPALHARALPKVQMPAVPAPNTFALLTGTPPAPAVVPPAAAPLFNNVTALPPVVVPPAAAVPGSPGAPGGPPIFPAIPPPGGGGGGVVVPPPVVPETPAIPTPPPTQVVPAVPEPASWAMMLFGFAMIGGMLRRQAGPQKGRALGR